MKIVLISLFPTFRVIGIRTLSAVLKKAGYDVKIIYFPKEFSERYSDKELDKLIELLRDADLVGISLMTNFFHNAVQITEKIHQELDVPVIWGGIHPTVCPEECMNHADIICIGEGEEALVELVGKMERGEDYHNVRNMWFKKNGKLLKNELRPLIEDIDTIPFPDYDFDTHFLLKDGCVQNLDDKRLLELLQYVYEVYSTRGCPFGCSYCCNNKYNKMYPKQKPTRVRSVDNVIEELMILKSKLSFIPDVCFNDDAFFIRSEEDIINLASKYKEKIGLPFSVYGAHPLTLTKEKLAPLVDAGMTFIRMGIQTGSENTKKLFLRHHSDKKIIGAATAINSFKGKLPNPPLYDIILDNPWETDKEIIETLKLLTKIPTPFTLTFYSLTFYPGTALYEKALEEGIISGNEAEPKKRYSEALLRGVKDSYLNSLFVLVREYAEKDMRINTMTMFFLTNPLLRWTKISGLIHKTLKRRISRATEDTKAK